MLLIIHKDKYQEMRIPALSLKVIEIELKEHLYSLPDGTVTFTGWGEQQTKPRKKDWDQFKEKMNLLPPSNPIWSISNILDGTEWEFFYEFEGHKIQYEGSNIWPEEYYVIVKALYNLTGFRRLNYSSK